MKYSKELLEKLVKESTSFRQVVIKLKRKPCTGSQSHITKKIRGFGIDTSHFTGQGWNKGGVSNSRLTAEQIFSMSCGRVKTYLLVRALEEIGRSYECVFCGNNGEWMSQEISLDIDHIDGNYENNRPGNLQYLCPNCHRLKGKNSRNPLK